MTLWVPISIVWNPVKFVWAHTFFKAYSIIPAKFHQPLAALITVAVFLIGTMVPAETGDNTRANRAVSLFGLVVMIALLTVTSRDWRKIPWHTVIGGMLTQFVIAVFVLRTQAGYDIFNFISFLARTLLSFAEDGVAFLTTTDVSQLTWFLISVVPPIIFFVALVQLLYHVGLLQWFVGKFAHFFFWTLRVSGAEAVVAAATPFIGQGESAMLIRPFVAHLTLAEIHQVMCCGFATIAGSVLVAYIGLGLNAQALVSSCIMSIPASLAVSKMRYPETEETLTSGRVVVPEDQEDKATNALHAFANGAWLGIKIAGMIIATLLCIIAIVSLINAFLTWWGKYWNITDPELTLELMLGYILFPVAWLLGVPGPDVYRVAQLIGMKIIENEYVAFNALTTQETFLAMGARSKLIATYACCVSPLQVFTDCLNDDSISTPVTDRTLGLRQRRISGYANRCVVTDRTWPRRRRLPHSCVSTVLRSSGNAHLRERGGHAVHRWAGWYVGSDTWMTKSRLHEFALAKDQSLFATGPCQTK